MNPSPVKFSNQIKSPPAADAEPIEHQALHQFSLNQAWCYKPTLSLILIVAFSIRLFLLEEPSYWFDESSSWKTIHFDWTEMLESIRGNVHPPVYYLVLKLWSLCFSDSPFSLRLFSAGCGLISIALSAQFVNLIYQTNGQTLNEANSSAIFTALLMALSPIQIYFSQNARMYSLAVLLMLLSVHQLTFLVLRSGRFLRWSLFAVSTTGLSLTHYYGIFSVSVLYLFASMSLLHKVRQLGWGEDQKGFAIGLSSTLLLFGGIWFWWFPYFRAQQSRVTFDYWTPPFRSDLLPRTFFDLLAGYEQGTRSELIGWLMLGVVSVIVLTLLRSKVWTYRLTACLIIAPMAISVIYSIASRNIFVSRYLILSQVFILLGWSIVLGQIKASGIRFAFRISTLLWLGFWCARYFEHRAWQTERTQLKNLAPALESWNDTNAPVIVSTPVIHVGIARYADDPSSIKTIMRSSGYPHYQGQPLLRDDEYITLADLDQQSVDRIFTIEVEGLYRNSGRIAVPLPEHWCMIRQRWFQERYQQPCRLFLREYQRCNSP